MKKIIELKKYRDFDQSIDAGFRLFKELLKPIVLFFWKNNRILVSALLISYFLYNYYATLSFDLDAIFKQIAQKQPKSLLNSFVNLIFFILSFIFYIRLLLTVFGFVKSYSEHNGQIDENEVKEVVSSNFWNYFFATLFLALVLVLFTLAVLFLYFIMIFLGSFIGAFLGVFLLLGFVLFVVIYAHFYYYILFVEKTDVMEAAGLAIRYIKERFWYVIGVALVLMVINIFFSVLFNYPLMVFLLGKFILAFDTHEFTISTLGTLVFSLYATVSFAAEAVLRIMLMIGFIITYHSIREARTAEAVYEKIDEIGKTIETQSDQIKL